MSSSEKQGCRQQLVSEGWEDKGRRAPGLAPQTTALMDVTGCCVNKPIQDLQGCGPGGRDPSRPCSGLGPHSPLQKPQVWGGTGGCGNRSITSQCEVSVFSKVSIMSVYCCDNGGWETQRPNKQHDEREAEIEKRARAVVCVTIEDRIFLTWGRGAVVR